MNYKTSAAWTLSTLLVAAGLAFVATRQTSVEAADHLDPPARTNPDVAMPADLDRNADIADVYAWYRGEGVARTAVLALSFGGPNAAAAGQEVNCDTGAIYQIHIDNNGDTMGGVEPTATIEMRLGEDDRGNCFYRITGIPGVSDPVVGAVGYTRQVGTTFTHVGLRADAFFFDLQGFRETLMTGTLAFVDDRDFFALKNTPIMVVEVPLASISPADAPYRVWATTSRIGS